jgi:uncharacterized protein (TIGR03083 family)
MTLKPVEPVLVADRFAEEREALLRLLAGLSAADWQQPTVCPGWSVKDLALHLLGDDLALLSRQRDGWSALTVGAEGLVAALNRWNEDWVAATRRLSTPLIVELLGFSGPLVAAFFATLDPFASGGEVSWAGPGPQPVWLDTAREYTERWLHQQQIRDATQSPALSEPRLFAPVLATFVHALPFAYRNVQAAAGTAINVSLRGESGGEWCLLREAGAWRLCAGSHDEPGATVQLDQDLAWRLFTKGIVPVVALQAARVAGDSELARPFFDAVAIIA